MQVDECIGQQLPVNHVIVQVLTEDGREEGQRRAKIQRLTNVLLYILRCCRRQSNARNTWQSGPQISQFEVVRTEIMAPLRDAVGLVHGQKGEEATGAQASQARSEGRRGNHLRGDVQQLQLGGAALQVGYDQTTLTRWELGIDGAGRNVQLLQMIHLVLIATTHKTVCHCLT